CARSSGAPAYGQSRFDVW
nr:immunoglobulin heavy chain junction region [Macaca mulatta]MOW81157.1 immunoglobulin heavy chain junction region [Macaca mulatta]MOW81177.1 immunoglobulin heavy chain junction region [Macaca mulatta]MOW82603.1 immunoglobulin heavy chain junction region [Macaca mulatta]MOW82662.1 immunoglobulin heavy chain junction region [Macaca mulatta]